MNFEPVNIQLQTPSDENAKDMKLLAEINTSMEVHSLKKLV